jgi:hypothetical protein
MHRRVRIKLAEFSMLNLTNSYVIKYLYRIADVSTTNRLARHRVTYHTTNTFLSFFSPAIFLGQKFDKDLSKAKVH